MSELRRIRRALISVSDKTGLAELAAVLKEFDVEIISTGGTARTVRDAGFDVIDVSSVTGFPEMMDGRVKTLHPMIHGAFLGLRDDPGHLSAMETHGIKPIDLVVVNLYPFEETVARKGVLVDEAIENIDIGGPSMIRSASKNYRDVAVVTDPQLYPSLVEELRNNDGSLSLETRRCLATLAYTRTASYDLAISSYLSKQLTGEDLELLEPLNPLKHLTFIESDSMEVSDPDDGASDFSDSIRLELAKITNLRYGENPHQRAALYTSNYGKGFANSRQLLGKEMSFNNYVDAEAAWALVCDLDEPAVAIIKHTNPCGVGLGASLAEAYQRALSTDPVSAFGGIVAVNRKLDPAAAKLITEIFTEVVVAPGYKDEALGIFQSKKNLRILESNSVPDVDLEFKQISGGFLIQDRDLHRLSLSDLKVVTKKSPSETAMAALMMSWRVCKHVKSNAIVLANENQTLGVGAGQMNRVDSVRIAAARAQRFELPLEGCAMASDAFFPFRDNIDEAVKYGVSAIIQPGGSVRDQEVIAAADEFGISMVFSGIRHFKH